MTRESNISVRPTQSPLLRRLRRALNRSRRPVALKKGLELATAAGFILSLYGLRVQDLVGFRPVLWTIGLALAAVSVLLLLVPEKELHHYPDREVITSAWATVVKEAEHEILVLDADIAVIAEHRPLLRTKVLTDSVAVRILASRPSVWPKKRAQVRALLNAGAEVRVIPDGMPDPTFTGLVADRDRPRVAATLREGRRSRVNRDRTQETGTARRESIHWAKQDGLGADDGVAEIWTTMLAALWRLSTPVEVLERIDEHNWLDLAFEALKQVDKYGALSRESVAFEYVPLDALSASCTYVREDKLLDLEPVFQQYAEQQVPVFAPCTRWSTKLKTILLPPIVERHDSQLVVVEGSHRIWHLQQGRAVSTAMVLVLSGCPPLPGLPVAHAEVTLSPTRRPRAEVFREFKPENWRGFKPMDAFLMKRAGEVEARQSAAVLEALEAV